MPSDHSTATSREIEGFPGYSVTSDGRVFCHHNTRRRPCPPREIKGTITRKGYVRVMLQSAPGEHGMKLVHDLVLTAFVGPRPDGMEACHWDGDKRNNRVENLRWDTSKNNAADNIRLGTKPSRVGSSNPNARLDEATVAEIRRAIAKGMDDRSIIDYFNLTKNQYFLIKHGRTWKHITV